MKIVLCILKRNDEILKISNTLKELGHEVNKYFMDTYEMQCDSFDKRIYRLGYRRKEKRYKKDRENVFFEIIKTEKPDVILWINLPDSAFSCEQMSSIREMAMNIGCKLITWLVDPLNENATYLPYIKSFDKVVSYEKKDVSWLTERGICASYCPVGYQKAYDAISWQDEKTLDVVFIGTPYKYRLELLEKLAIYADSVKWKIMIAGPFYKHFWKKYSLKRKYPHLYKYIVNRTIDSLEAAQIYQMSKVCLNIHTMNAGSLNPRSYEIMAAGGFQLLDKRSDYNEFIAGREFAVFSNAHELINRCNYYINNPDERRMIALAGKKSVEKYSMINCLKYILSGL